MELNKDKLYDEIIFDDIYYLKHEFITVHKKEIDKNRQNFIYSFENGTLYRVFIENGNVNKEETMYVHFQKRNLKIETSADNYFTIIPNKYIAFVENPDIKFLKIHAAKKLFYSQYFSIKLNTLKKKFRAWKSKSMQ